MRAVHVGFENAELLQFWISHTTLGLSTNVELPQTPFLIPLLPRHDIPENTNRRSTPYSRFAIELSLIRHSAKSHSTRLAQ